MKSILVGLLLVVCVVSQVPAGDCVDFADHYRWAGSAPCPGQARGIAVAGDHAYVAADDAGLIVYDIARPAEPAIVAEIGLAGAAVHLDCRDGILAVSHGYGVVGLFDVSDPAAPAESGRIEIESGIDDVTIVGDRLYLSTETLGLLCYDIGDPGAPREAGRVESDRSFDLFAAGDLLYASCGAAGLVVYDAVDPWRPVEIGRVDTPGVARQCVVEDGVACVADGSALRIVDVSDPSVPTVAGTALSESSFVGRVFLKDSRAYVPIQFENLAVIDVSDPTAPFAIGHFQEAVISDFTDGVFAGDLLVTAMSFHGIGLIDVGSPEFVPVESQLDTPGTAWDVVVSGVVAYMADGDNGIQVVDTGDPASPVLGPAVPATGRVYGVALSGTLLVGAASEGLLLMDVAEPLAPQALGGVPLPGASHDVVVADGLAYVAAGTGGLQIVDVSDVGAPDVAGALTEFDEVLGLHVAAGRVFLVDRRHGLRVVDASDPSRPAISGSLDLPGWSQDVTVCGDRAYVVGTAGVHVIDVASPDAPTLVATCGLPGESMRRVSVGDGFLLVAARTTGFHVVDIRDPDRCRLVGHVPIDGFANASCITGRGVYLAGGGSGGLTIIEPPCSGAGPLEVLVDVKPGSDRDPVNLRSRGVLPVAILTTDAFDALSVDHESVVFGPGEAREAHVNRRGTLRHEVDVDADGDRDLLFHFRVQEIGLGAGDTEARLMGTTYDGRAVIGVAMFGIVPRPGGSRRYALGSAAVPNPFNPQTTIAFGLPMQAPVTLRIYDISGRLVRSLLAQTVLPAGPGAAIWKGRDDAGQPVASGVYFYRLEAGGLVETRRMLLVK